MSYDGVGRVLVFVEEVGNTRECYLVDVLVYFLFGHTDTAVADGQRSRLLVEFYVDGDVAHLAFKLSLVGKCLQFLRSVNGVRHHLAQEYFMVRVEKLFYHGEDVLCCNPDITFLHIVIVLLFFRFHKQSCKHRAKVPLTSNL